MSVEQKLDEILQKQGSFDEALNNIMRYLHENLPVKTQQKTDKPITAPSSQVRPASDKTVKINNTVVPPEIAGLVHIAEGDDRYIITKPWTPNKQEWKDINNFMVSVAGDKCWIPEGKLSRWEIPKK